MVSRQMPLMLSVSNVPGSLDVRDRAEVSQDSCSSGAEDPAQDVEYSYNLMTLTSILTICEE